MFGSLFFLGFSLDAELMSPQLPHNFATSTAWINSNQVWWLSTYELHQQNIESSYSTDRKIHTYKHVQKQQSRDKKKIKKNRWLLATGHTVISLCSSSSVIMETILGFTLHRTSSGPEKSQKCFNFKSLYYSKEWKLLETSSGFL